MNAERDVRWRRFIIETATIVFGVLVALGLDAGWAAREDRARLATHMAQAASDLAVSEAEIRESILGERLGAEAALTLTASESGELTQHPDTVSELFGRALLIHPYRPMMGTIDAVVESGDIRLVGDATVRNAWIRYRNAVGLARLIHESSVERSLRVLERLGTSIDLPELLRPAGDTGTLVFDPKRLDTDTALRSDVYLFGLAARNRLTALEDTLEALEVLSDALARVMER